MTNLKRRRIEVIVAYFIAILGYFVLCFSSLINILTHPEHQSCAGQSWIPHPI
uniref:Uncharacterized protein n=1 Tax=Meloidogyne enterolobii TaxID=390850 RepID=A0A6V7W4B2_MELEN|nr:unnamed protein product [Meloidogyne enterolobii]